MTKCVFILTPCNINAISTLIVMNNIRKELIMIATREIANLKTNLTIPVEMVYI